MKFVCPSCHKGLEATRAEVPTLPFCSPRCRAADLGKWLNESYRISAPLAESDLDEGVPGGVSPTNEKN